MDPHGPYYPSLVFDRETNVESTPAELMAYNDDWSNNRPIAEPGLSEMVALYEAKIEYLDRHLATFLDWLTETGRYDDAMIVVTADHGQFVGEETRFGHDWGFFPEDPLVRVPLFVKFPGDREGDRVSHPVQHRDIVATVARAFDVDAETDPATSPLTDAEGRSILTKSNAAVRGVHADGEVAKCAAGELDIEGDPPERLVEAVRSEDLARVGVDVGQAQMSADERESVDERLEQLGYK
jgi:arylsulfatase A-like enzyme